MVLCLQRFVIILIYPKVYYWFGGKNRIEEKNTLSAKDVGIKIVNGTHASTFASCQTKPHLRNIKGGLSLFYCDEIYVT